MSEKFGALMDALEAHYLATIEVDRAKDKPDSRAGRAHQEHAATMLTVARDCLNDELAKVMP